MRRVLAKPFARPMMVRAAGFARALWASGAAKLCWRARRLWPSGSGALPRDHRPSRAPARVVLAEGLGAQGGKRSLAALVPFIGPMRSFWGVSAEGGAQALRRVPVWNVSKGLLPWLWGFAPRLGLVWECFPDWGSLGAPGSTRSQREPGGSEPGR